MSIAALSVEQLSSKLQTIKNFLKQPYTKYPEEILLLVEEAFKRGISIRQIHLLSGMPDPTLRYIKRRLDSESEKEQVVESNDSKGVNPHFVRISVEEESIPQENTLDRSRAKITMAKEGELVIELGIESLTSDLLRSLRSIG